MASLGQPLIPISKKPRRLSLRDHTPIQRRLRNGVKPMSEGFKPNCYASMAHKKNCRALLFGNCDCIPHLAVTIDVPYWQHLTQPYWTPLTEDISRGVVLCTNLVVYTPISCASVGPHLRLWTCYESDIKMLHGVCEDGEARRSFAFLRTRHVVYGVQVWIPHDFIKSCEIGEVGYDYIYESQLMVDTMLVYQTPSITVPDLLDVEAEFMMYRLVRLEDWSETSTLSETSSIGSFDDEVVLDFMTLKKKKRFLVNIIDFENLNREKVSWLLFY